MLATRKFLRTLLGRATPDQIMLACMLGSLLGFLPVTNGGTIPALVAAVLLLVLDANLLLAGVVAAATKLLSIALAPVAFMLGRVLLDGPTEPLARWLINGPVTAWFGFDSYLATGGLVLGLVIGIGIGLLASNLIRRLRHGLADLEESSPVFQAFIARRWVRWTAWIVFGGIPKNGFSDANATRGLPIRWSGTVLAIVVVALATTTAWMLSDGAARGLLQSGLARINGATVDVEAVEIDWIRGRAAVVGFAACDPDDLGRDFIRVDRIGADLDLDALLRRRLTIDLVEVEAARLDEPRSTPGRLVGPPPPEERETTEDPVDAPIPNDEGPSFGRLEDHLETARIWRTRLEQLQRVIEDLAGRLPEFESGDDPTTVPKPTAEPTDETSLEAWLREQVDLHGYAGVRAIHLLEEAPRLLVRRIEARDVRGPDPDRSWNVVATSMSTEPGLVDRPFEIEVRDDGETARGGLVLAGLSAGGGTNRFEVVVEGMPAKEMLSQLLPGPKGLDGASFRGGTIDAALSGEMDIDDSVEIEAPLEVVLRDSLISIGGESATVPELAITIRVSGSLGDPRITIDQDAFADALQSAGADALASRARSEVDRQIDRGLGNLEKKTGVTIPEDVREGIGGALEGLFGGDRRRD